MEYAKEEFLKINYSTQLKKLEIGQEGIIKKVIRKIKEHKFLSMSILTLIIFSVVNVFMIYSFIKLFQNL